MAFSVDNISYGYTEKHLIENFSIKLNDRKFTAVVGPNGCGKTTFLHLLADVLRPKQGRILFQGSPLDNFGKNKLAREIALMPQDCNISFPFSVRDVVMMGRYPHMSRFSQPSALDNAQVDEAMKATDTAGFADRPVTELSGGERQRVVAARTLAQDTPFILLDEATSNLDIRHAIALLKQIKKGVEQKGRTVIAVFQDINLAVRFCDDLLMLKNGRIEAFGNTDEVLTQENLRRVFDVDARVRFDSFADANQVTFAHKG